MIVNRLTIVAGLSTLDWEGTKHFVFVCSQQTPHSAHSSVPVTGVEVKVRSREHDLLFRSRSALRNLLPYAFYILLGLKTNADSTAADNGRSTMYRGRLEGRQGRYPYRPPGPGLCLLRISRVLATPITASSLTPVERFNPPFNPST